MPDTQISDEMVEKALDAWLSSPPEDTLLSMRAALEAAISSHVVGWQQAAMAQFIMWCMNEGPWDGCDLHGGDVQDKAEELGLIVKTKFDPKIHGERIEAKEGGDWFVPAEWLLSALPAPPVPEMEG